MKFSDWNWNVLGFFCEKKQKKSLEFIANSKSRSKNARQEPNLVSSSIETAIRAEIQWLNHTIAWNEERWTIPKKKWFDFLQIVIIEMFLIAAAAAIFLLNRWSHSRGNYTKISDLSTSNVNFFCHRLIDVEI